MLGGWYCTECGWITRKLPVGLVTCERCGYLGLVGFDGKEPPEGQEGE